MSAIFKLINSGSQVQDKVATEHDFYVYYGEYRRFRSDNS